MPATSEPLTWSDDPMTGEAIAELGGFILRDTACAVIAVRPSGRLLGSYADRATAEQAVRDAVRAAWGRMPTPLDLRTR